MIKGVVLKLSTNKVVRTAVVGVISGIVGYAISEGKNEAKAEAISKANKEEFERLTKVNSEALRCVDELQEANEELRKEKEALELMLGKGAAEPKKKESEAPKKKAAETDKSSKIDKGSDSK